MYVYNVKLCIRVYCHYGHEHALSFFDSMFTVHGVFDGICADPTMRMHRLTQLSLAYTFVNFNPPYHLEIHACTPPHSTINAQPTTTALACSTAIVARSR